MNRDKQKKLIEDFPSLYINTSKDITESCMSWGFEVVGFVHDEIICEVHNDTANSDLAIIGQIMIDKMKEVVPNVRIGIEGQLQDKYCK